ncbi:hypothetical protein EGT74_12710 [Chitinophaga lutea]|uniref:Uncharacterized protein n=1 Tax=Chitinophaga lutea TaxID=2488634 RepID=A0A3N4PGU2_9BACT|nr:hypothetical protein [Chitinophaga lutea]RPE07932.1 hypothetical protein EGT74_12710 [Chitinophaga lutea]
MAPRSKIIGNDGLEQGGDNLGNDYGRNITREKQQDDTLNIIVPRGKKQHEKKEKKEEHERFPQHPPKK